MGLSKHSKGGRAKPAMNVTPLVDIVLVLLIIFMVVLPNQEKGAAVEVPTIAHGEEDPDEGEPIILSIDDQGRMYLDAQRLDDETFTAALDQAHAAEPERKLMLRADRDVKYARIRALFAIAQDIGFPGVMMRVNGNPDTADGETVGATESAPSGRRSDATLGAGPASSSARAARGPGRTSRRTGA
ncbi:MAG: biopolymer transporter ExbD [Sandaracinus sp.]|nr:biopolymer transporter ExbD [Sandaracinus sp.]